MAKKVFVGSALDVTPPSMLRPFADLDADQTPVALPDSGPLDDAVQIADLPEEADEELIDFPIEPRSMHRNLDVSDILGPLDVPTIVEHEEFGDVMRVLEGGPDQVRCGRNGRPCGDPDGGDG